MSLKRVLVRYEEDNEGEEDEDEEGEEDEKGPAARWGTLGGFGRKVNTVNSVKRPDRPEIDKMLTNPTHLADSHRAYYEISIVARVLPFLLGPQNFLNPESQR